VPFPCVCDALVLNQLTVVVREKVRAEQGISVGYQIQGAKYGAFFAANTPVKLLAGLKQLNADSTGRQTLSVP